MKLKRKTPNYPKQLTIFAPQKHHKIIPIRPIRPI